jgi:2-oxoglutarate ferredoxin oxidoreductase subunit beta
MDNQIYGLTKGQLSPTSPRGLETVTSPYGSFEQPVNPLAYVLAYGAGFVAQGTPADVPGLAAILEEAIRYRGFSFVNVQSPCVTYGEDDNQMKVHKAAMKPLAALGHDPSDKMRALALAEDYGRELHTGVFYRNPNPPPPLDALIRERQTKLAPDARPRERILDRFVQH